MEPEEDNNEATHFSIIIPTYNRPRQLKRCLEAISKLVYPHQCFEVIVADDESTLPVSEVVAPFEKLMNVTLVRTPHAGPAAARNAAARRATGEYFVFTDDDCAPHPQWLQALANAFARADKDNFLLGGHTRNLLTCNAYSTASQLLVDYLYGYYGEERSGKFFTSNNFALSALAFWKLKGFDESFPPAGEDRDFCRRALDSGMVLQFIPEAEVGHFHALTLHKFRRQHLTYGNGAFQFHFKRARNAADATGSTAGFVFGLPRPEPISFYTNMFCYPWRVRRAYQFSKMRAARLSLLLFLSQFYNAAGYFRRRFSRVP